MHATTLPAPWRPLSPTFPRPIFDTLRAAIRHRLPRVSFDLVIDAGVFVSMLIVWACAYCIVCPPIEQHRATPTIAVRL